MYSLIYLLKAGIYSFEITSSFNSYITSVGLSPVENLNSLNPTKTNNMSKEVRQQDGKCIFDGYSSRMSTDCADSAGAALAAVSAAAAST